MNTGEIINKIRPHVSSANTRASILSELNKVLKFVAAQTRLPDLITTDTVTVAATGRDSGCGVMPSDYHHDLLSVWSNTNEGWITIRSNTSSLYKDHNIGDTGPIEEVAVEDDTLYGCPEAVEEETLLLKYYKTPTALAADADIPSCIPEHLHGNLLVDGAIAGMKNVNDDARPGYVEKYNTGFRLIKRFFPRTPKAKPVLRRSVKEF